MRPGNGMARGSVAPRDTRRAWPVPGRPPWARALASTFGIRGPAERRALEHVGRVLAPDAHPRRTSWCRRPIWIRPPACCEGLSPGKIASVDPPESVGLPDQIDCSLLNCAQP